MPPPLQTATLIDTRLQSLESSDPLQLATEDKRDLLVAYAVKYRISDPMKYSRRRAVTRRQPAIVSPAR